MFLEMQIVVLTNHGTLFRAALGKLISGGRGPELHVCSAMTLVSISCTFGEKSSFACIECKRV